MQSALVEKRRITALLGRRAEIVQFLELRRSGTALLPTRVKSGAELWGFADTGVLSDGTRASTDTRQAIRSDISALEIDRNERREA
jgi:hypothetical protein